MDHSSSPQKPLFFLPSPSPEAASDSEGDYFSALEAKRQNLSEQVEDFKLQKEHEFRSFEEDLRSRKTRGMGNASQRKANHAPRFRALSKGGNSKTSKPTRPNLGPSSPSVSLDKVTISGTTTPPISSTPPLVRALSYTSPLSSAPRSPIGMLPPTPPASAKHYPLEISHGSPNTDSSTDYFDDRETSSLPETSQSRSPSISSPGSKPSSLPSALKSPGTKSLKRKHVTFQLSHSVVVDTRSSYPDRSEPSDTRDDDSVSNDTPISSLELSIPSAVAKRLESLPRNPSRPVLSSSESDDFFDLDEDMDQSTSTSISNRYNRDDDLDPNEAEAQDEDQEGDEEVGLGISNASPAFSAGSLPIKIVRSSSFASAMKTIRT